MIQQQIRQGFPDLSAQEVQHECNTLFNRLIKLRKCCNRAEAENFVEETLTRLVDAEYRERFNRVRLGINPRGIALAPVFTRNTKNRMDLQWSIYQFLKTKENKKKNELSGLTAAIRSARAIHSAMPSNSRIIINQ